MSTVDKFVAADLVALAAYDRRELPSFADSLVRLPIEEGSAPHLELLPLAHSYALRVGQGVWGAAALACVWVLMVFMHVPMDWQHKAFVRDTLDQGSNVMLVWLFATAIAGYARRFAEQRFTRFVSRASDPVAVGSHLVDDVEPWSISFRIAGVTSLVVLFGVVLSMVENHTLFWFPTVPLPSSHPGSWNFLAADFLLDPENSSYDLERLRDLRIAMVLISALAVVIGRSYVRQGRLARILREARVRWIAIFLSVVLLVAAFDLSALHVNRDQSWILTIVTALGAGSFLVSVASFAVKRGGGVEAANQD
ncbi:MAG TPA: hypothetical protein VFQ65_27390 [Kofleriaceae bacterium]|nr:hypothetical protein [Kofleriaceae bacterium]